VPAQLAFAIDRVKALAPTHPEWKTRQPFKAALEGDLEALVRSGEKGLVELVMATHVGQSPEEFQRIVNQWLATARDQHGRRWEERVYQPMLELLAYLRMNGFKTYIVTGGGVEFVRAFAERVYGVPPEQVIGSSVKTTFEVKGATARLVRQPRLDFIDDRDGKPVAINQYIGRRPIAAFGNSDGDLAMLQWTAAGPGRPFGLLVQHTDGEREYAYGRQAAVGRLSAGLSEALKRGWVVVDMKHDWKTVYPPAQTAGP
jgi:phosphoserine phosphatase